MDNGGLGAHKLPATRAPFDPNFKKRLRSMSARVASLCFKQSEAMCCYRCEHDVANLLMHRFQDHTFCSDCYVWLTLE